VDWVDDPDSRVDIFAVGLALTSGSLAPLAAFTGHPAGVVEVAVLTASILIATLVRFVLLRLVFRTGHNGRPQASSERS
jgi:hypothetical protein